MRNVALGNLIGLTLGITLLVAGIAALSTWLERRLRLYPWDHPVVPAMWTVRVIYFVTLEAFSMSILACYLLGLQGGGR